MDNSQQPLPFVSGNVFYIRFVQSRESRNMYKIDNHNE